MRSSDRSSRGMLVVAAALAALSVTLLLASRVHGQEATRGGTASAGFMPQATVVEVMNAMVMSSAQALWDSVSYESGPNGDVVKTPDTDEAWEKLRWSAVTLAEAANVLLIPGRKVDAPGVESDAPDAELSPAQIQTLIDRDHDAWAGHARALHEVAMQAIAAIDSKDGDQIVEVGGTLDSVCEGCHLQFWYPNQAQ